MPIKHLSPAVLLHHPLHSFAPPPPPQVTWVKDKQPTLTAADLQRSIDISKGIHPPGGSIDAPKGLGAGSDWLTQVRLLQHAQHSTWHAKCPSHAQIF